MRSVRLALISFVGPLLTGCIGIAHISADVRPLEVEVTQMGDWTSNLHKIEVVCPHFYGDDSAFVALLRPNIPKSNISYEWHSSEFARLPVRFICTGEKRYIGFPVLFSSMAPSSDVSKSRNIFLRVDGMDRIYQINVVGKNARIRLTNLSELRATLPPPIEETTLTSPQQTKEFLKRRGDEFEFYKTIAWVNADGVEITEVINGDDGDILSIRMRIKQGGKVAN